MAQMIQWFTGKERDAETGLDYFGARYFSGAQGRFTSPDSPSYANRKNPQTWNLYAYALNNPVTFADADGHEIVCANNAQQCQKDAAAATGNADAAKRVSTTTTTTQHSFLGFHWTTSTTTIAISGDMASFRALSQNASRLADLVENKGTVTVTYDQHARPSFWAQGITLNGGSTSYVPSQGYDAQAFIDPTRTSGAIYDPDAVAQGIPQANTAEEFGHEVLGHVWGELNGGDQAGTRANMRDSITGEDAVRKLDPTRGQKALESHHNYNEMPPDK
jgi:RHS repeat-associated protein